MGGRGPGVWGDGAVGAFAVRPKASVERVSLAVRHRSPDCCARPVIFLTRGTWRGAGAEKPFGSAGVRVDIGVVASVVDGNGTGGLPQVSSAGGGGRLVGGEQGGYGAVPSLGELGVRSAADQVDRPSRVSRYLKPCVVVGLLIVGGLELPFRLSRVVG